MLLVVQYKRMASYLCKESFFPVPRLFEFYMECEFHLWVDQVVVLVCGGDCSLTSLHWSYCYVLQTVIGCDLSALQSADVLVADLLVDFRCKSIQINYYWVQ